MLLTSIRANLAVAKDVIAAPTSLALVVDSDTEITLNWTDPAITEGEIRIERSLAELTGFAQIAVVALGDETYQDTGLEPATEYFYRIRAFYLPTGNSAYSATESDTTDP